MKSPTPAEIVQARKEAGLSQTKAAALVYASIDAWQHWEAKEGTKAHRKMPPGLFELFRIKTNVKPENNPLPFLKGLIVFDSKDYSLTNRDAWIWGIVCGWNDEALAELSKQNKWSEEDVTKLRALNENFKFISNL